LPETWLRVEKFIDMLQQGVIKAIITPHKVYYPNENALLMAVEFGAANQYSRDLSQNVKRGQVRKAKNGCPPSRACIGFINDQSGGKGEKGWLIDETRLPIIKQMFQMYLSGNYSGAKIHEWAYQIGKLTTVPRKKSGNRIISRAGVYRMLSDPIYAGFFYLQGERYELASELPRIISEVEHYTILRMLGGSTASKPKSYEVIYSGYIRSQFGEYVGAEVKFQLICDCKYKFSYIHCVSCPKCKAAISSLNTPKYLNYVYYRNVAKARRKETKKYISENEITKEILAYVENNLILSTDFIEWCKKHYRTELLNSLLHDAHLVEENKKKRVRELEAKKLRYREMLADDLFSKEEYIADVAKINIEIACLDVQKSAQECLNRVEEILTIGSKLVMGFKNGTRMDKRGLLAILGVNLIWDEKNLIIICKKEVQRLIDGLNEAKSENGKFEPKRTLADRDRSDVFASVRPILRRMCDDVWKIVVEQSKKDDQKS
jgi:hypothetical protein